jgi:general secretion pathway protein A
VYKSYFGLKKNPFNVNPDPAYLYLTPQMRDTLDELTYGIETRKGLILLTGEAGTGKTTLVNHLLLWLGHQRARTAYIFNSHVDADQLFDFILTDFDIPITAQVKANPLLAFNEWLLARYRAHDLVVLIVDESQGLPVHVLEEIRLLSNMETPNEKLLQIVLVGQPELEIKLKRPDLRQLQQRIALRCRTAPLSLHETSGYIEDRLHTAGARGDSVFSAEAVEAVHSYSRGIPRIVNLLCENALINAYVEQQRPIPAALIEEAARELQFDEWKPLAPRVRTISPPVSAVDLQSVLAQIREDAEVRLTETTRANLHVVDTPQTASSASAAFALREGAPREVSVPATPVALTAKLSAGRRASRTSTYGIAATRGRRFVTINLAAARESYKRLDLHSKMAVARDSIRALQLPQKSRAFVSRARNVSRPAFTRLVQASGPEWKARAEAVWNLSLKGAGTVRSWCLRNFTEQAYGKSFAASAVVAALLYLVARGMNPAQGWQHPARLILSFAGLLLCGVSVAIGATILIRARRRLVEDSAELLIEAVRWLQAPLPSLPLRRSEVPRQ